MTRASCILLLLWLGRGLFAGNLQLQDTQRLELEGTKIEIPAREHVVAHVVSALGASDEVPPAKLVSLLTRDSDGLIKTYSFRTRPGSSAGELLPPVCQGYVADLPPGLAVEAGEIPVRVIRSSCLKGLIYWAVVTLSFDPTDPLQNLSYNLYVFSGEKLIFYKPQAGMRLEQFVFRDLDGDCLPEMIDVDRSHKIVVTTVRLVKEDGSVADVQELSGDRADIACGGSIKIDERCVGRCDSGECFKTRSIQFWDSQRRRFADRQKPADRR